MRSQATFLAVRAVLLLCVLMAAGAVRAEEPAAGTKRAVTVETAPKAIGPYSQAVVAGNLVFTSGQIGLNPKTQKMVEGGIRAQTEQALENLAAVLAGAGVTMTDVVKTTIFLADISDYAIVNEIYGKRFGKEFPARSTVQVTELPKAARVEIDMIAVKP